MLFAFGRQLALEPFAGRRGGKAAERRFAELDRHTPPDLAHRVDDLIDGDAALDARERHIRRAHGVDRTDDIALDAGHLDQSRDGVADKTEQIAERDGVRIRALLRRANAAPQQKAQSTLLTVGGVTIDPEQRVALKDGKVVELTAKEYDLIELLVKNPRRVYSRENLMDLVWGYTYAGDYRTVDVHIRRLREKLEENPAAPQHILTKWGVGYYLKD